MTRILAALPALLAPAVALAHAGPNGHAHPHGLEIAVLGALAALAAVAAWRWLR